MKKKSSKPYPDFPLFEAKNGQWAKKIRGKRYYFGVIRDPQAALRKYLDQRDDLQAGRTPRSKDEQELTVGQLCNSFLAVKEARVQSGELGDRTFQEYLEMCKRVALFFGKEHLVSEINDAELTKLRTHYAKGVGVVTVANRVRSTRVMLKYAFEAGLIAAPIRCPSFREPSRKVRREDRQSKPKRLFDKEILLDAIEKAQPILKAMILLGINCGFGNGDCSNIRIQDLDLKKGWHKFARPKTAIPRSCQLWPETVKALKMAIALRPNPKSPEDADQVFLTKYGKRFVRTSPQRKKIDSLSPVFRKFLVEMGVKRERLDFYALRHTVETIGGAVKDQPALDLIMGHVSEGMSAVYNENIDEERLIAITDHIRGWLFG